MMDLLREYSLEVWGNWDGIAVGDQIFKRGEGWNQITSLPLPHVCACPKLGPRFLTL